MVHTPWVSSIDKISISNRDTVSSCVVIFASLAVDRFRDNLPSQDMALHAEVCHVLELHIFLGKHGTSVVMNDGQSCASCSIPVWLINTI